jgi:hypothetical protein
VIHLQTKIEKHRLNAFINGLLSGLGLILILWGLSSIVTLPSTSVTVYIGTILFGVSIFMSGGLREAYVWGRFSMQLSIRRKTPATQTKSLIPSKPKAQPQQTMTTEQMTEYPVGTQTRGTAVYEQESPT